MTITADDVEPGQAIRWCDRRVQVLNVHRYFGNGRRHRPSVVITIEADDVSKRNCHYYAEELVTVL
jgi:hypothetical protein